MESATALKTIELIYAGHFPAGESSWDIKIFQNKMLKTVYLTKECKLGITFHTSMYYDRDDSVAEITSKIAAKYDIEISA